MHPASGECGTGLPHDADAFRSNWPKCVVCGGLARPAVLMFGDSGYVDDGESSDRFDEWKAAVGLLARKHGWRVTILEVGCGGNVTTIRMATEELL